MKIVEITYTEAWRLTAGGFRRGVLPSVYETAEGVPVIRDAPYEYHLEFDTEADYLLWLLRGNEV